jgi:hypothetical protein
MKFQTALFRTDSKANAKLNICAGNRYFGQARNF